MNSSVDEISSGTAGKFDPSMVSAGTLYTRPRESNRANVIRIYNTRNLAQLERHSTIDKGSPNGLRLHLVTISNNHKLPSELVSCCHIQKSNIRGVLFSSSLDGSASLEVKRPSCEQSCQQCQCCHFPKRASVTGAKQKTYRLNKVAMRHDIRNSLGI